MYVRLCTGVFWYYLEQAKQPPRVQPDYAYPLTHMPASALHRCCFRVLYHHNRIAVEFFHALTDGTGAMVYLKTLTARYITLKYHVAHPARGRRPGLAAARAPGGAGGQLPAPYRR